MSGKKYAPQDSQILDDRDILMAFAELFDEVLPDDEEVSVLLEEVGLDETEIEDEITTLMTKLKSKYPVYEDIRGIADVI